MSMYPFDSDENTERRGMKPSTYLGKENQYSLMSSTRSGGRVKHKSTRKSGSSLSEANPAFRSLPNDINLIRTLLGKLIESAQAERQWHITHHNNISCIAKALNSSMEHVDPSLPKVVIIPPTFLASHERRLDPSPKSFGETSKSLWENKGINLDLAPALGGKRRSRTSEMALSQLISRAHHHHTLHSESVLHERLRAVNSVENFLQLDQESFSRIFPLLCDWLFSINVDTNFSQDPWDDIEDKEFRKKTRSVNCYHAFLLLYEGIRFYPEVFLEPRHNELVRDIFYALRNLYDNHSWIREVGLLPCDISSLNNHLVQVIDQAHRKTSVIT